MKKYKKEELLEIMLAQSEEIDALKARIEELEDELAVRDFKLDRIGSIAEASLAATKYFEEAEKAAALYLENVKNLADKRYGRRSAAKSKADKTDHGQKS